MPRVYKFLTAIIALTGCLSLVISGETNPLMSISGLAMVPGYYRFLRGEPAAGKWTIGALSLLTLAVFFFDARIVSGDVFLAVAHLTIAFQAIKSFDLKEPWDHLQVFFVSLLQLVIASELSSSIAFGIVFLLFMVMLVAAMVLSHFLKEGHTDMRGLKMPVFLISLLVLLATFFFFIAFPRTSFRFLGKSHARAVMTSGFSANMDFGSFGSVKLDPTVVMRVEIDRDPHVPLYWRGITFDYFDGLSWKNTSGGSMTRRFRSGAAGDEYVLSPYDRGGAFEQRIYLEPMESDVIFGLSQVRGVKAGSFPLLTDKADSIYLPGKSSRMIRYTVYSTLSDSGDGGSDTRYLQLPAGMERIAGLARSITAAAGTDDERARLIERYLQKNYIYSLTASRPQAGMNPIEDFLFYSRRGYCEHYSTSMVLMLRSLGIPSRTVNGFYGGEMNRYGGYIIVRESNAHSWVEALIDGRWKRFDPTPAVASLRPSGLSLFLDSLRMDWSRYVVGFSSTDQVRILRSISSPFALPRLYARGMGDITLRTPVYILVVVAAVMAFGCLVLRNFRLRRHGFVTERYLEFRRVMRKKGISISPATTAGELREKVRQRAWKNAGEFLSLYEDHRFGKKEMGPDEKRRYEKLLREVKREG